MPIKKTKPKPKAPTPIRIPDELKAKLQHLAEKDGRTLSNLIINILKKWVEGKN